MCVCNTLTLAEQKQVLEQLEIRFTLTERLWKALYYVGSKYTQYM